MCGFSFPKVVRRLHHSSAEIKMLESDSNLFLRIYSIYNLISIGFLFFKFFLAMLSSTTFYANILVSNTTYFLFSQYYN
jgi:hypothetical protein